MTIILEEILDTFIDRLLFKDDLYCKRSIFTDHSLRSRLISSTVQVSVVRALEVKW